MLASPRVYYHLVKTSGDPVEKVAKMVERRRDCHGCGADFVLSIAFGSDKRLDRGFHARRAHFHHMEPMRPHPSERQSSPLPMLLAQ